MKIKSFLFGDRAIEVRDCTFIRQRTTVTLTPTQKLMTPCGTINFPAGTRVFFGKVRVDDDTIIPLSGGIIQSA